MEHLIQANTPLPVTRTEERFGTILAGQESVRIQVFEQAGPSPSAEVEHNRRVLDGELTKIGSLPAGSVIKITVKIAVDGGPPSSPTSRCRAANSPWRRSWKAWWTARKPSG